MKKILFLTGTRADFGKLKPLMRKVSEDKEFELSVFVTGMHMLSKYGNTQLEVEKAGFTNIYKFVNQHSQDTMDITLSKTITGLSDYVKENRPDMIVIHGDRVEALAGAIVGSLNNILVAHVEGGEVSGTIDESIRHAVSKMSHIHYVSNEKAKKRLLSMGENKASIFVIGSPDLDVMSSPDLPDLFAVKEHYDIGFSEYAIALLHPVTTNLENIKEEAGVFVDALIESRVPYIVVYPNNDIGNSDILDQYQRLNEIDRFKLFPSIAFESFLVLLKNSKFIVGNSSAGVREAPFYGVPGINIGSRQKNRSNAEAIINCEFCEKQILKCIDNALRSNFDAFSEFGVGDSSVKFLQSIKGSSVWGCDIQKEFFGFSEE
ncbi:MAG: UDP-N-acetylglucosamine 2-epimerase [Pseudomonadota bacterium]